jgi:hypothetical protein
VADPWDPLAEEDAEDPTDVDVEVEPEGLIFDSASAWVESWLVLTVRRRLGPHMAWCADWWAHREAAARVESLWAAWELAQAEGGASPSQWWVYHFTPHWAALTDARGPFAGCTGGHVDDPAPLPVTRDPASVPRTDTPAA